MLFVGPSQAGHRVRCGWRQTAARWFAISASCTVKLVQRRAPAGSAARARKGRPKGSSKPVPGAAFTIETVDVTPDVTLPELGAALQAPRGVTASAGSPVALSQPTRLHISKMSSVSPSAHARLPLRSVMRGAPNVSQ